jgi:NTP pyrophosphatase (non-canonical NTP hydrolase)
VALNDLQTLVKDLAGLWESWGQWQELALPRDSIEFMVTELGEAIDARIRVESEAYTRNNPDNGLTWADVDVEVGDVVIMALRYFNCRGVDVSEAVTKVEDFFSPWPSTRDCLNRMAVLLGRAIEAMFIAELGGDDWWLVDANIAKVVLMARQYFNLRGVDMEAVIDQKLILMHHKKNPAITLGDVFVNISTRAK